MVLLIPEMRERTPKGSYEGSPVASNWADRKVIPPSPDPVYGVYSVGIATPDLGAAVAALSNGGVVMAAAPSDLPHETATPTQAITGPDYTRFVLVERPDMRPGYAGYGIDHVRLLVRNAEATRKFFEDLYFADTVFSDRHNAVLEVIDIVLVLSEPEALGLSRDSVQTADRKNKIRYGPDHIAWLSNDIDAFTRHADSTDYRFEVRPFRYSHFGEPTLYRFGFFLSPDELQVEIVQEDGRSAARTVFADPDTLENPPWPTLMSPFPEPKD